MAFIFTLASECRADDFAPDATGENLTKWKEPEIQDVLAALVTANGGSAPVQALNMLHLTGRITLPGQKHRGGYSLYITKTRRMREDITLAKGSVLNLLSGQHAFTSTNGLPNMELFDEKYIKAMFFYKALMLPYTLADGNYNMTLKGIAYVKGRRVNVLKVLDTGGEGPLMTVYVDAKNGNISKVQAHFTVKSKERTLTIRFEDFRKVESLSLPFRIIEMRGSKAYALKEIKQYTVNPATSISIFNP